ncbi:cupredoxin family copper-binding protein [Nocardia sp. NPDC051030]|uniref:cupredoxin domain-containing protein n=1 Tax=Nocardia sp. NPDC051030 TaxID=3155162 RepID=UPI00342CF3D9
MRAIRSRRRASATLIAAAATLLTLSACGGGSPGNKAPDTAAPTPVFASGTETPGLVPDGGSAMPGMPNMSTSVSAAAAAPTGPNAIDINNFAFSPATLTVKVGTTVTWTNRDEEPHTVAADNDGPRSSGLGTGATYTFTFSKAGTFAYVCTIHPFMHGTVVVTQ